MADYVSIAELSQGWTFFIKKMSDRSYGRFPCSDFGCSGCDDWLDCDNENRKVKIFQAFFQFKQLCPFNYKKFLTIKKKLQAKTRVTVGGRRPGQSFQGEVSLQRRCNEICATGSGQT